MYAAHVIEEIVFIRYRAIDGTCNNLDNAYWGAVNSKFARLFPAHYADGHEIPFGNSAFEYRVGSGEEGGAERSVVRKKRMAELEEEEECGTSNPTNLPEPRLVSMVFHEDANRRDVANSLMVMQFGQFLDHDVTLTPESEVEGECCDPEAEPDPECLPIPVTLGDFFHQEHGLTCLEFTRSTAFCAESMENREQFNIITHYIDLSNIYGSEEDFACTLRTGEGGLLRSQDFEGQVYLPFANGTMDLVSGDIRAIEMPGLTGMHTLFLREHNLIASTIASNTEGLNDEEIFQETRRIMIGIFQNIVFREFLPAVIGPSLRNSLVIRPRASSYRRDLDVSVLNEFATAAYRFGHTLIQGTIETR